MTRHDHAHPELVQDLDPEGYIRALEARVVELQEQLARSDQHSADMIDYVQRSSLEQRASLDVQRWASGALLVLALLLLAAVVRAEQ